MRHRIATRDGYGEGVNGRGTPRRRRVLVGAGVAVLLLAVGFAVADLVLRTAAEHRIAGAVRDALGVTGEADAHVGGGRPLLLQAASGRLDEVRVTADEVSLDQGVARDVVLVATGVSVSAPTTARAVTVTGTVPTAEVRDRLAERGLDVDVAVAGDGMRASGDVLGLPWGVTLAPRVEAGRLLVDVATADLAGVEVGADALPVAVRDALSDLDVPIDGLPDGLELTSADVVADGLAVTITGRDVVLPAS